MLQVPPTEDTTETITEKSDSTDKPEESVDSTAKPDDDDIVQVKPDQPTDSPIDTSAAHAPQQQSTSSVPRDQQQDSIYHLKWFDWKGSQIITPPHFCFMIKIASHFISV